MSAGPGQRIKKKGDARTKSIQVNKEREDKNEALFVSLLSIHMGAEIQF